MGVTSFCHEKTWFFRQAAHHFILIVKVVPQPILIQRLKFIF